MIHAATPEEGLPEGNPEERENPPLDISFYFSISVAGFESLRVL